jgi:NAD(P)-dependent dehydrogenase (short-subunit alcohol dehydrogenase family)
VLPRVPVRIEEWAVLGDEALLDPLQCGRRTCLPGDLEVRVDSADDRIATLREDEVVLVLHRGEGPERRPVSQHGVEAPRERAVPRPAQLRFGQGREVAQASLWLASEQSSYVTGTALHVDVGRAAR